MTKMEKERAVFDAVSGIDPVLVQEAAEMARPVKWANKKQRRCIPVGRILWKAAAVAAALALIVSVLGLWPRGDKTASGFGAIEVYAYDTEDEADAESLNCHQISDSVNTYWPAIILSASTVQEITFGFEADESQFLDAEITFELSTNYGCLRKTTASAYDKYQECAQLQQCVLSNGEIFSWHEWHIDGVIFEVLRRGERVFIDVVIKADERYIGYAVFEIVETREQCWALVGILQKIEYFVPENGQWQDLTQTDIAQRIESCHQEEGRKPELIMGSNGTNAK